MAIGKSKLHEMLRRARRISDIVVFGTKLFADAKEKQEDEILTGLRN